MDVNQKYDVIVIGSGMGGLFSALILAKEGKKVCVLEKNNQYGGHLQCFVRNKTVFDTGVHYLGSLAEGQVLYQYFKYAGIMNELSLERLNPDGYDVVCFGDDSTQYPHAQGDINFVKQLTTYFPSEEKVLETYCNTLQEICNHFPLYELKSGVGDYTNLDFFSTKTEDFIKNLTSNTKLQAVLLGTSFLYGGITPQTPLYVHALTVNSYMKSAWRCRRGSSQITNLLVKELRKYGGKLFKYSQVSEFLYEGKNIQGVRTTLGKTYYADIFVSNIDVKTTLRLTGESHFKKVYYKRIMKLAPSCASFSLHIVLKPNTFAYFRNNIYYFDSEASVWDAHRSTDKGFRSYIMTMNPPTKNPYWAEGITILTYMNFDQVKQWENTFNSKTCEQSRGQTYEDFKNQKAEELLTLVEKKFPHIRSCIEKIYTSSPLSYRDYIGSEQGNMYGYLKNSDSPTSDLILPHTHIPNLFLTGQTVNMHGILGVTIGAVRTCSQILGGHNTLITKIQKSL